MAKEKICLIINPISGTDSKKNIPEEVAAAFDQRKNDLFIRITGYPDHATEIARKAAKKNYKYVLVAGGDGTVNEVAKSLVHTNTTLGTPIRFGERIGQGISIP
jgi:diacylglycerol kinase family enzyme